VHCNTQQVCKNNCNFFQYATQQSTKLCYLSCVNSLLSYSRKTTFKMADVRHLEFRKLNFSEITAIFTSAHQISSKSDNYFINDIERFNDLQHSGHAPSWIFKSFNFWSYDCHHVQYLPWYTKFHWTIFTAWRICIAQTMPSQDVHLSVRPSHAGIESKRLYISLKLFHHRVAPSF